MERKNCLDKCLPEKQDICSPFFYLSFGVSRISVCHSSSSVSSYFSSSLVKFIPALGITRATFESSNSFASINKQQMEHSNVQKSKLSSVFDKFIKRNNVSRHKRILSASSLVSYLVIVILVVCFCLMVLHPRLLHQWASYYLSWESKCLSPVCITQAADIMRRMDKSVDPCTDFYQFSCGGLDNKYNVIPDQDNTLGTDSLSQLEIDKRLKGE